MSLPKPFYEHDSITIFHADCRDILPEISQVDLLLTDPPYGVNWQGRKRTMRHGQMLDKIIGDDGSLDITECLRLSLKCLRRGRHVYIFGNPFIDELPLCKPTTLIWDKQIVGVGDLTSAWGKSHEEILFAVYEISQRNRELGYGNLTARLRKGSVLRCQRKHSEQVRQHPTEKPVEILRQMIESSSMLGEIVLDPFMGIGSTLVACRMESRKAIGIEIEEKYCEIAAKRLEQEVFDFA